MPAMKSDARWIADFRARYGAWWAESGHLIEQHDYAAGFKTYPWPSFTEAPWTPVAKPLGKSRIAVVTTGGLYRPGADLPFDGKAAEGDWGFRALPAETPVGSLEIAHAHFPHDGARADMNTIFPLDRLRELAAAGVIGELAPTQYSTMGYCLRAADLAESAAPEIAARMTAEGVDAALIVPV